MAEFRRYCPLCGQLLKNEDFSGITTDDEQERYLCLRKSHYPFVILETREQPDLRSCLLVSQKNGAGVICRERHCFFCGGELEAVCIYKGPVSRETKHNMDYLCHGLMTHAWREMRMLDSIGTLMFEEQDFETFELIYNVPRRSS